MYALDYQARSPCELFSSAGKEPDRQVKRNGPGIGRVYERSIKGYMYTMDKASTTTSIVCPNPSIMPSLGIVQPLLVMQMWTSSRKAEHVSLEVVVLDQQARRRRLHFSSTFREACFSNELHAQIPWNWSGAAQEEWTQVVFDLEALTSTCFKGACFSTLESFCLRPVLRVRKVFSLPGIMLSQEGVTSIPPSLDFPIGVHSTVTHFASSSITATPPPPSATAATASGAMAAKQNASRNAKSAAGTLQVAGVRVVPTSSSNAKANSSSKQPAALATTKEKSGSHASTPKTTPIKSIPSPQNVLKHRTSPAAGSRNKSSLPPPPPPLLPPPSSSIYEPLPSPRHALPSENFQTLVARFHHARNSLGVSTASSMAEAEHPPLPPFAEDEQQVHAISTSAFSSSLLRSNSLARYLQEQTKKQQSAEQEDAHLYGFDQGKRDYLYEDDVGLAAATSSSSFFAEEQEEEEDQRKGNDEEQEEEEEEEEEEEALLEEDAFAKTRCEAEKKEEEIHTDEELENGDEEEGEEGGESFLVNTQTPSTPPNILARSVASPLPLPRSLGLSPHTSFPAPAHYANSNALTSSPNPSRVHVLLSRRDAAAKKLQEAEKDFELEFGHNDEIDERKDDVSMQER